MATSLRVPNVAVVEVTASENMQVASLATMAIIDYSTRHVSILLLNSRKKPKPVASTQPPLLCKYCAVMFVNHLIYSNELWDFLYKMSLLSGV